MREVRIEDCKVGMVLKLKEDCPFREAYVTDSKATIKGIVKEVYMYTDRCVYIRFCDEFEKLLAVKGWYFYADDTEKYPDDDELISLNLEYANKRKNNYY